MHQKLPKLDRPPGRFGRWMALQAHRAQQRSRGRRKTTDLPSGLIVWLDANQYTTPEDDPVTAWLDQSGHGHNAVADVPNGFGPAIFSSSFGPNNAPLMIFDGVSNAALKILDEGDLDLSGDFGIFMVAKLDVTMDQSGAFLCKGSGPTGNPTSLWWGTAVGIPNQMNYSDHLNLVGPADDGIYLTWALMELHRVGTDLEFVVNGTSLGHGTLNASGFAATTGPLQIAKDSNNNYIGINIVELLIYRGAVSGAIRTAQRSRMNSLYVLY